MRKIQTLIGLLVGLILAVPGFAGASIDFGTGLAGTGGVFTLNGANATGTNIPIGVVTITGAPLNNGVFLVGGTCTGSGTIGSPYGCLNFNTATNTLSITGSIPSLGIAPEVLLSGTFTGFTANGNGLLNATGPDSKAADLLTAVGLSGLPFSFFGFSLTSSPILTNPGTGSVSSTDIRNDAVPEPASVVLLGTILLGSCMALRRRAASRA